MNFSRLKNVAVVCAHVLNNEFVKVSVNTLEVTVFARTRDQCVIADVPHATKACLFERKQERRITAKEETRGYGREIREMGKVGPLYRARLPYEHKQSDASFTMA